MKSVVQIELPQRRDDIVDSSRGTLKIEKPEKSARLAFDTYEWNILIFKTQKNHDKTLSSRLLWASAAQAETVGTQ